MVWTLQDVRALIRSLASKYQEIEFIKIDVDELKAMPTIVLLKQGKEVGRFIAAKKDELEKKILQNMEAPKFTAWLYCVGIFIFLICLFISLMFDCGVKN